jgi:hypothetical protein
VSIYAEYDGDAIANLYRKIAEHRAANPNPITELKVTREQLDEIQKAVPTETNPTPIMRLVGIPVVLVDTEEESTLFTMTWEALVERLRRQHP